MQHPFSITPNNSLLLIVDIQERLCKVMNQKVLKKVCSQINLLASLSEDLKIPILLTEQYPEGLGPTIEPIKKILEGEKYDSHSKVTFGCCEDETFNKKLETYKRKKIIITGMETHVCVYLTALGLINNGYHPFIASDAVISRDKFYYKNGLDLMRQVGCVVSNTETILFQLMVRSGTDIFKKISKLLKESIT